MVYFNNPALFFIVSLALYLITAFLGLIFFPKKNIVNSGKKLNAKYITNLLFIVTAIASCINLIISICLLIYNQKLVVPFITIPYIGEFVFIIDLLSAIFLLIISFLGFVVSIYSLSYVRQFILKRHLGLLIFLYNIFLFTMSCVVTVSNGLFFLIVWEGMSIATYFLITYEHENKANRHAGFLYIVMTHIGTTFLLVMFFLMFSQCNSFDFESFKLIANTIPFNIKTMMFFCALIGFGIKSGVIPFHIWLPEAHPAAPSNISSIMSGVMIKMGIYGMIRVFFDFLGVGLLWWGILILFLALSSGVLGVLYALMEHDIKKLLAYHSIENIGIILMGIGVALIFHSLGNNSIAMVGLIAALYHTINHATFKGLLFLAAGSVVHATGTRNIEELGGLIKKLPYTALFFLIGSVAISALPPLNGFISEWLTFQSFFLGFNTTELSVKIALPLSVALLALTSALAAACFVKAFGITFLGLGRSKHTHNLHESSFSMLSSMGILSLACIFFGLFPSSIVSILQNVVNSVFHSDVANYNFQLLPDTIITNSTVNDLPIVLTISLLSIFGIIILSVIIFKANRNKRILPTWACGLEKIYPRMQFTATGFSKAIRMIFSSVYKASREIETTEPVSSYYKQIIRVDFKAEPIINAHLKPLNNALLSILKIFRKIQTGDIQTYLAYIFISVIILLFLAH